MHSEITNMPATRPQDLISIKPHLKPGEEILFNKRLSRFLGGSDLWLLTNQRLLVVGKKGLEEKTLLVPGEYIIYHETGESQFSGNVHLLTNQQVIVLDIGARDYILESVSLSKISKVDIQVIREGWINSIIYGLQINGADDDESVMIKHGGVTTGGIDKQDMDPKQRQRINERFLRKLCEVAGLKFAIPEKRAGAGGATVIAFYSKSNLVWPNRCSACYKNTHDLVYDEYSVENPWLAAEYHLGFGLIPEFTYQIPYCSDCYRDRLGLEMKKRAVKESGAKSDGARVELCFENQLYAMEFAQNNSS
jgi:hypothetical protein